jgi:hypothetical protein
MDIRFNLAHPDAIAAEPVSSGDSSGENAEKRSEALLRIMRDGVQVNLHKMKCMAPELFAREFQNWSPLRLALLLGEVDEKTARNYLAARHSPQWPVVAGYLKSLPPEQRYPTLDRLIGEDEDAA